VSDALVVPDRESLELLFLARPNCGAAVDRGLSDYQTERIRTSVAEP
jgi:hypothetical protein